MYCSDQQTQRTASKKNAFRVGGKFLSHAGNIHGAYRMSE